MQCLPSRCPLFFCCTSTWGAHAVKPVNCNTQTLGSKQDAHLPVISMLLEEPWKMNQIEPTLILRLQCVAMLKQAAVAAAKWAQQETVTCRTCVIPPAGLPSERFQDTFRAKHWQRRNPLSFKGGSRLCEFNNFECFAT